MCVCLHVCITCGYRYSRKLDKDDVRSPGVKVTGYCEQPIWVQGTDLWSSERAVSPVSPSAVGLTPFYLPVDV